MSLVPGKSASFAGTFFPNTANFMGKLIYHPCSVPFVVYVETLIPCFIELLILQNIPLWDDVVRAAGFAQAQGQPTRGAKKRRHVKLSVGKHPEGKNAKATGEALRAVLRLSQPLENVGYLMLMYGSVERFFYNWTLLLHDFEHCGLPPATGPYQRTNPDGDLVSPGTWVPLFCATLLQDRAGWGGSSQVVALPFGKYSVTIEATFTSTSPTPWSAQVGFRAPFSLALGEIASPLITTPGPGTVTCTLQADVLFPTVTGGSLQWLYRSSPIPVGITVSARLVSIFQYSTVLGS